MESPPQAKSDTRPVAVITGGTEGLGLAYANLFAKDGHDLLLVARSRDKLERAAEELARTHGVTVETTAQDLSTEEGRAGVERALEDKGLHAEYLVNNAALALGGFFQDGDRETLLKMIDLNVGAVVDLTRRLMIGMLTRGSGRIMNISSMTAFQPTPYELNYAASKAFVVSFSRALAYECMYTGVTVSVVAPGVIATDLHAKAGATYSRYLYMLPVMTPEQVASRSYRPFMRGKKIIVPGIRNKLLQVMGNFTPNFVLVPFMGMLFRVLGEDGVALPPGPIPGRDGIEGNPESGTGS
ncbi:putative ketoacyl reductase [Methyloligella halotolerans]|uniref:Putative ketoacyl reductase n=1 Tax=Methyloligella halotolerans TaxID=1177755 RepID=A0A1E2S0I3_9HYPH|nr:SDR family oxidoreductase [Methyloligella halotolerans]ODA67922.1 putative ketoacyl reductase [Methyloligella halotolerans]